MRIQLVADRELLKEAKVIVLPVFEEEVPTYPYAIVKDFIKENPKFGKNYETQLLYDSTQSILLLGVGKKDKFDFEKCQNMAGVVVKSLGGYKEAVIIPPAQSKLSIEETIYAIGLGAEIASHDPSLKYKTEVDPIKLTTLFIYLEKVIDEVKNALKKAGIVSEAINLARMLGDMPSNEMTPTYFLNTAKKIAKENKLKLTVLDEKKAKAKNMGAFVGVAKGSDEPSYLIALEYTGDVRSKEKLGLVGKGLTFDSGGISIKPGNGMDEMKYDMCGAGTVLATLTAISKMDIKANVVGICAVTENLPGGKALKPGDILKMYSGKTAEILNTDAEGRLVLADGLSFAQKDFKATRLIDLATLTGAMIVALGDYITGAFSNSDEFTKTLIEKGTSVGEKFWQMPMDEDYDHLVKSKIADLTNLGHGGSMPSAASSIAGAKFLEKMVDKNIPWIHLDIAGTAWDKEEKPYRGAGATGVGVKTLIELISR